MSSALAFRRIAAKRLDIPSVYTLHTIYEIMCITSPPPRCSAVTRRVMRRYNTTIFPTGSGNCTAPRPSVRISACLRCQKPIYLFPTPWSLTAFCPNGIRRDIRAVRNVYALPPMSLRPALLGGLGKEKSVGCAFIVLGAAVFSQDKFALLIVGNVPSVRRWNILPGNSASAIWSVSPAVPHEEIPPYYAACNAY